MHRALLLLCAGLTTVSLHSADTIFSGPQPGEKLTPFKVNALKGARAGTERDPITAHQGAATALVFIHGVERSLVPLLRAVDTYGASNVARLRTEIIFLNADRIAGEQRTKAAANSLRLQSPVGLSPDGAEGPGNYGLNKDCLMTIVASRSNVVFTNFALVQPGIADAPRVIAALAKLIGDTNPPSAEVLLASGSPGRMDGGGMRPGRAGDTNAGAARTGKDPFPGAVPTDAKLQGLLRQFIRPTNDNATVDNVLADVKKHIGTDPELRKQALDGWTRVLHFGDRYGTEYSRKIGTEFLQSLQPAK